LRSYAHYYLFPRYIHEAYALYTNSGWERTVTKLIVEALYTLNNKEEDVKLSIAGKVTPITGKRVFEVGVADGHYFNFMDEDEVKKLLNLVESGLSSSLDFLVMVRYYYFRGKRKIPLRFDKFYLRVLSQSNVTYLLYHVFSGLGRVTPGIFSQILYNHVIKRLSSLKGPPGVVFKRVR